MDQYLIVQVNHQLNVFIIIYVTAQKMINIILKRKIYVERCKAMIKKSYLQADSTG